MRPDRQWMYEARVRNGFLTEEFVKNLESFIEFACSHRECMRDGKIKCPCPLRNCKNKCYLDVETVKVPIAKNGLKKGYYDWNFHGESVSQSVNTHGDGNTTDMADIDNIDMNLNIYERMIDDTIGSQVRYVESEESPNPEAEKFYNLIQSAKQKLWNGSSKSHTQLSATVRLLEIKSKHQATQALFNDICQLFQEVLPDDNHMPKDFYSAKKLVRELGLPAEVIHCCIKGCMIYWGDDCNLNSCRFCGHPRYKPQNQGFSRRKLNIPFAKMFYFPLIPRLQRLYASNATASEMRRHAEHVKEDGKMCHPSDSMAWRQFDQTNPDFAAEVRNVRLGLCADGFQPFGKSGQQYSSWPIILTPYNLPPGLCMKEEFFFLTVLVPGPKNPKGKIDVYLQPLIAELKKLWDGVQTYDISKKNNFQMRAALLWTINDFPAYAMLSGWSTAGRLACPYCKDDSDAFSLRCSRKTSWFDNHRKFLDEDHTFRYDRNTFTKNKQVTKVAPVVQTGEEILSEINNLGLRKVTEVGADEINGQIRRSCGWTKRSIFWDLPYWSNLLIRHNIDAMHTEKNVFDNVFNTALNVQGKTKDTMKSREELNDICNRPKLAYNPSIGKYPKDPYVLDRESKKILCDWVQELRFPDGYASNLSRCVDLQKLMMFGMKSHDCHVFMQRLLPIAFRYLLPRGVWESITELCIFFKELTSTTLYESELQRLEKKIPEILCKLERIFPPSFFDSMKHLPIHLAYEAKIAGPAQYRWMYPFERYMHKLKKKVSNKSRVEGSICNGYIIEEFTKFSSYYFQDEDPAIPQKPKRNEANVVELDDDNERLSIYRPPGQPMGNGTRKMLTEKEYAAAHSYVLLNCPEVQPFVNLYENKLREEAAFINDKDIDAKLGKEFPLWFRSYACSGNIPNPFIRSLAQGPLRFAKSYKGYYVNGYRFHNKSYGESRRTMNSGVCIKGSTYNGTESDYYGLLNDVIELEYPGMPIKRVVLFNCDWFDPRQKAGTVVHPHYKIVDIDHRKRFQKYEPFVLAAQATQVYFCTYPSKRSDKGNWWTVCKVKARSDLEIPESVGNDATLPSLQDDDIREHQSELVPIDIDNNQSAEFGDENEDDCDVLEVDEQVEEDTNNEDSDDESDDESENTNNEESDDEYFVC